MYVIIHILLLLFTLMNTRPWGTYKTLQLNNNYHIKEITVYPNQRLSLQSHEKRAEHWTIIKGIGLVYLNNKTFELHTNDSIFIPVSILPS